MFPCATFSIVAFDPARQEWGVAVASKFLAAGAVVPWARAGAGAVATQSYANTRFGPEGLDRMAEGLSAEETLAHLLAADPEREKRQVGLVTGPAGLPPSPAPNASRGPATGSAKGSVARATSWWTRAPWRPWPRPS
jgi:hypothetical protein